MSEARVIKKYPNRRLYDTVENRYIILSDIRRLVLDRIDFIVTDKKTQEDITRSILLQVIVEQEHQGEPLLSQEFLAQVIRDYGTAPQGMVAKPGGRERMNAGKEDWVTAEKRRDSGDSRIKTHAPECSCSKCAPPPLTARSGRRRAHKLICLRSQPCRVSGTEMRGETLCCTYCGLPRTADGPASVE